MTLTLVFVILLLFSSLSVHADLGLGVGISTGSGTTTGTGAGIGIDINIPLPTVCSINGLATSYDVVIVGAGLGGSVAARRLAEANPSWQILLIDRGIPYETCVACQSSSDTNAIYTDLQSGGYLVTAPQRQLNNATIFFKNPAVQGGGTAVNGEAYIRGDAFRYFPENYPINWNYPTMLYYYQKYENYTFPPGFYGPLPFSYAANFRGNNGPVNAAQQPARPFGTRWLNTMRNLFPNMPVFNNYSLNDGLLQGIGAAPTEVTSIGNTRVSAYTAYIRSYKGTNLKSITNTLVTKVVFNGTAVSGVNLAFYTANTSAPLLGLCTIKTKRVVMSAGTIGTPKTLKLSGVGPAAELKKFGIPVVANVPGVGENFNDQFVLFDFCLGYTDNLVNNNFPDQVAWAFYNVEDAGPAAPQNFAYNLGKSPGGSIAISTSRINSNSRGTVKLSSSDPRANPIVDPNYFAIESEKIASGIAIFKLRQAAAQLGLTIVADPCTGRLCDTPSNTFNSYIAGGAFTVAYHFTSTASLCNVTNPLSLRVAGTSGLYVLDASILPKSPNANTQSTAYAVAEHGADLMNVNMHIQDKDGAAAAEILGQLYCKLSPLN